MVLTPCGQGGFDNDIIKNGLRKNQAGMEGGGGRPQAQMRSIPDPLAMPSLLLIAHYAYAPPPTHTDKSGIVKHSRSAIMCMSHMVTLTARSIIDTVQPLQGDQMVDNLDFYDFHWFVSMAAIFEMPCASNYLIALASRHKMKVLPINHIEFDLYIHERMPLWPNSCLWVNMH
jgi:hypothetical protein